MMLSTLTDNSVKEVYMIFRVYRLGRAGMGMRILVDPESERKAGRLKFLTDGYTVTPSDEDT